MRKYLLLSVLSSLLAITVCATLNYQELYTDSQTCKVGRQQSPVVLADEESSYNVKVYPVFPSYLTIPSASLTWTSDNRILEVQSTDIIQLASWGSTALERDGVLKQYLLKAIEINFPGEHVIQGVVPDLEVKLIHEKSLSFQTTVNQHRRIPDANRYLIISLLFKKDGSAPDNGFIDQLVASYSGSLTPITFNLDIDSYALIQNRKFYFYEGSFTSEPCDEVVNYIVINELFKLSEESYNFFQTVYSEKYKNGVANKRTADYYGRSVYRNYAMNITEADSSFINFSYLLAVALVFLF